VPGVPDAALFADPAYRSLSLGLGDALALIASASAAVSGRRG